MKHDLSHLIQSNGTLKPMETTRNNSSKNTSLSTSISKKAYSRFKVLNKFCDHEMCKLNGNEISVWLLIFRHSTDGIATLAQTRIAQQSGKSTKTIQRTINKLVDKKLIEIVYRGGLHRGLSRYKLI